MKRVGKRRIINGNKAIWGMMAMLIILIVVIVSCVYTDAKTYWIYHLNICHVFYVNYTLIKLVLNLKVNLDFWIYYFNTLILKLKNLKEDFCINKISQEHLNIDIMKHKPDLLILLHVGFKNFYNFNNNLYWFLYE